MADAISIYLDTSTTKGALYSDTDKTAFTFAECYQGATLQLRIYPCSVIPNPSPSGPFLSVIPLSGLLMQVVVGPSAGTEAIKAAQYTWTAQITPDVDDLSGYFYADLNLNTDEMNAAIGSSDTYTTKVAFLMSRNGGPYSTVHQANITLLSVVKDPTSEASVPTPTVSYMTADQCWAAFVPWDNRLKTANYGRVPIFVSPDGSHTREAPGVDNDGNPTDNLT